MNRLPITRVILLGVLAAGCGHGAAFDEMSAVQHDDAAAAKESLASDKDRLSDAPELLRVAHEHRDAAEQLRLAAASACAGVPRSEQASSMRSLVVLSVEPLYESIFPSKGSRILSGATVRVAAEPGLTEQWLGRVMECHMAQHRVLGELKEEGCPLATIGAVEVVGAPGSFLVRIRANDRDAAAQVLQRARGLLGPPQGRP
jgi:hypothetical protein